MYLQVNLQAIATGTVCDTPITLSNSIEQFAPPSAIADKNVLFEHSFCPCCLKPAGLCVIRQNVHLRINGGNDPFLEASARLVRPLMLQNVL